MVITCKCGGTEFHVREISLGRVEVCLKCGEQQIYLDGG